MFVCKRKCKGVGVAGGGGGGGGDRERRNKRNKMVPTWTVLLFRFDC